MLAFGGGGATSKAPNRLSVTLPLALTLALTSCATPPQNPANLCDIFREKRGWYKDARKSARRWNADIPAMMAMVYQESSFQARAKPPRKRLLGFIPWRRPASAYGYAQAIDSTWALYQKATGKGGADRNDFDDAIDFVAWYNNESRNRNRIPSTDAYNLYLAYHEGNGGFAQKTYVGKQWLIAAAQKVSTRATNYRAQFKTCEKRLNRNWLLRLLLPGD